MKKTSRDYGRTAYENGWDRVPRADTDFMRYIKTLEGDKDEALCASWLAGYDEAAKKGLGYGTNGQVY